MEARLEAGSLRRIGFFFAVSIATLAAVVVPAQASSASPVLEFVPAGGAFPVPFTATGGEITAEIGDLDDTLLRCTGSAGEGAITGPRTALADYSFTGCKAEWDEEDSVACKSPGAGNEEIRALDIGAELVFVDQAKREVGMVLNPSGGAYLDFECANEPVEARGPFVAPVGPVNEQASFFTATLSRSGTTQLPSQYETVLGEQRQAIPLGKRGGGSLVNTGVALQFTIETGAPLEVRAITAAEVEAKQRQEEEAAAAKKRQGEEAAAAKKRQEEEAAAAARQRQAEESAARAAAEQRQRQKAAQTKRLRTQLSSSLKQCRQGQRKGKRVRCEKQAKRKYDNRLKAVKRG